ncbi:37059_t:CDS:1, partial [Racocetra persica]
MPRNNNQEIILEIKQQLAEARTLAEEISARINQQAEAAKKEVVYNEPLHSPQQEENTNHRKLVPSWI